MIKKFPARLVGHRPKSIILKSESSPKHGLKYTDYQADEAAKVRFNEKFDPDTNTYESIKIESVKAQAAEDIASRTGTKKWGNLVVKKLKRENIFKKSISTAKDKPRFVKKWEKLLKSSNIEAEATRVNTALLFTGRKGLDPLKYQPGTETKYITSKRFRKGKFDQPYPKYFSKIEFSAFRIAASLRLSASTTTCSNKEGIDYTTP